MYKKKITFMIILIIITAVIMWCNHDKPIPLEDINNTVNTVKDNKEIDDKSEGIAPIIKDEVYGIDVTPQKGYTSYLITYRDTTGKKVAMNNKIQLITLGDKVYLGKDDAEEYSVLIDYYEDKRAYYFQIKTETTFTWRATPKNTDEWKDAESSIVISVNPDEKLSGKVVEYIVTLDYDGNEIKPTINKKIR